MSKKITKAGQLEVGQRVEYIGRRYDFPTRSAAPFTVQGEITEFCRGSEDRNVVHIDILANGVTHYTRAAFHPTGVLRFMLGESIRVLTQAPMQREITA